MRISYNWLKDFIHLPETPEEIAQKLTQLGLEVEHIGTYESIRGNLQGVVVGEVLACQKHPNADKLSLTKVAIGNEQVVSIVCGASNVQAGQKVLVATIGTTLYPSQGEPLEIKKTKIRGEVSEGMICAEDELGLGTSHDGILILQTDLPNGTPAAKLLGLITDTYFEIGLTPNRADAASHLGVARDLKTLFNRPIQLPDIQNFAIDNHNLIIEVKIENTKACPRYAGITLTNVVVKDSPQWLQNRLKSIGLTPINNVVDITNYVLHELGQPIHAFDAQKIKGKQIIVKTLPEGTPFLTLDKQERQLKADDLMICNAEEGMCIAGVFGGLESGITQETTSIFLESAYFNPDYIRKTSQAHGLKTDASFRFERGVNPEMTVFALKRAALLIKEIAGGQISSPLIDIYPQPILPFKFEVSYKNIHRLIGTALSKEFIHQTLQNLEIEVSHISDTGFQVKVPPYRIDVQREVDIIEELTRFYGFGNIPLSPFAQTSYLAEFEPKDRHKIQYQIGQLLANNGFYEIYTNSLTKPVYTQLLKSISEQQNILIINRLSEDLEALRQSLIPSGLEVIAYNLNRKQKDIKIFEFGKTYHKQTNPQGNKVEQKYTEKSHLAIFLTGNRQAETWQQKSKAIAFQDLYNILQIIFQKLNLKITQTIPTQNPDLVYGLDFWVANKLIAQAGLLTNSILKFLDIKQQVFFADIDWQTAFDLYQPSTTYQEIPKFPEVRRDLSLVLDKKVTFQEVQNLALSKEKHLIKNINVFDVYEGESIGKDKKAYAISFILQDENQTLTDKIIDKTMEKLMQTFEKELGAIIRK
ncbi:MAG: phenylalanine--tRNA ligase subunit beta [Microscillaceae bacterium]|nr:phenylalanine--tRNA ligase subunit beta [Microscillaceae bacterium]MDW8460765.1 phenylalanine--tRNA ligase subunit beta [Cytophagales bacterium]